MYPTDSSHLSLWKPFSTCSPLSLYMFGSKRPLGTPKTCRSQFQFWTLIPLSMLGSKGSPLMTDLNMQVPIPILKIYWQKRRVKKLQLLQPDHVIPRISANEKSKGEESISYCDQNRLCIHTCNRPISNKIRHIKHQDLNQKHSSNSKDKVHPPMCILSYSWNATQHQASWQEA